jgi:Zn-finger protein
MNDSTFFVNKDCKYYPCHKDIEDINCLFCFCPWYYHCGSISEVKCENCTVPHKRDSYDMMMKGIKNISESKSSPLEERNMFNQCRCAKQITIAIIENNGEYWLGTNWCLKPQKKCPRGDMPSGEGYELCKSVCQQIGHAEEEALKAAGNKAKGGNLFLLGHTYICSNCKKLIEKAGIAKTFVVGDMWKDKKEQP